MASLPNAYRAQRIAQRQNVPVPMRDPNMPVPVKLAEPTATNPYANSPDEFNRTLSSTLLKRYGNDFDLNDPNRGLAYFQRRRDETNAEGDPRDTAYWDMRASGVNEAWYAQQEAANRMGTPPTGWTAPEMSLTPNPVSNGVNYGANAPLPNVTPSRPNDPAARQSQQMRRDALLSLLR